MNILGKARTSEITAYFKSDIKTVWQVITDNSNYKWRSDIEKIEIMSDGEEFIEYTHDGNATKFSITKKEQCRKYEFNMENKMFTGNWTGRFEKVEKGGTKIAFTENIFIKNPFIRLLSYFLMDLKKIQNTYITDLKKELGES